MRTPFYSYVHIDIAAERGPVGDREAVGFDVSDQAPTRLNVHARRGGHVARELACDADGQCRKIRLDDAVAANRHGLAGGQRAPDGPFDRDRFVTRELAFDDEPRTNYAACHITSSLKDSYPCSGLRAASRRGSSRPKQVSSPSAVFGRVDAGCRDFESDVANAAAV